MTLKEVSDMIKNIGLPYAYMQFDAGSAPSLPFVVYRYPGSSDFKADGKNYQSINQLEVTLCTKTKDFTEEKTVEAALTNAGLCFEKNEDFLEDENMLQITYDMEVVINE